VQHRVNGDLASLYGEWRNSTPHRITESKPLNVIDMKFGM